MDSQVFVDLLELQEHPDPRAVRDRGDHPAHWEIRDLSGLLAPVVHWVRLETEVLAVLKEAEATLAVLDSGVI